MDLLYLGYMIEIEYKGGKSGEESFLLYAEDEGACFKIIAGTENELKRWVQEINERGYFEHDDLSCFVGGASGGGAFYNVVKEPVHVYWIVSGNRYYPTCGKFAKYNDQRPDTKKSY